MIAVSPSIQNPPTARCECGHETWRDIPGFPDYQASSLGRVRSRKSGAWQVMRATPHSGTGYLVVSPRVAGRYVARSVHRLIAKAFLGDAHGRDVNHVNGDKHDNSLRNLEYLSRGDNHRHAYRTGLRKPVVRKLTADDVRRIRDLSSVASLGELSQQFGVKKSTIGYIIKGKAWKHVA